MHINPDNKGYKTLSTKEITLIYQFHDFLEKNNNFHLQGQNLSESNTAQLILLLVEQFNSRYSYLKPENSDQIAAPSHWNLVDLPAVKNNWNSAKRVVAKAQDLGFIPASRPTSIYEESDGEGESSRTREALNLGYTKNPQNFRTPFLQQVRENPFKPAPEPPKLEQPDRRFPILGTDKPPPGGDPISPSFSRDRLQGYLPTSAIVNTDGSSGSTGTARRTGSIGQPSPPDPSRIPPSGQGHLGQDSLQPSQGGADRDVIAEEIGKANNRLGDRLEAAFNKSLIKMAQILRARDNRAVAGTDDIRVPATAPPLKPEDDWSWFHENRKPSRPPNGPQRRPSPPRGPHKKPSIADLVASNLDDVYVPKWKLTDIGLFWPNEDRDKTDNEDVFTDGKLTVFRDINL